MKISLGTKSLARMSAKHPWFTLGIWVVALIAAGFIISTLLGGALVNTNKMTNNPESDQAGNIIGSRLGSTDNIDEMVIVKSSTLTVDDSEFRGTVESMYNNLIALGSDVVVIGVDYYITGDASMVSADRHSTFISLVMPPDGDKHVKEIYAVTDTAAADGTFEVYHTGTASFNADVTALAEDTMKTGETVGIAVALVVLAIVFGAVAAALLPISLGAVAIAAAIGLTALVGQVMDISFTVTNMITMMGLAVGIDYSLFILSRFREERKRGLNKIDAITATGATASKSVLFSGITVLLALSAMVFFPMTMFRSMGMGAILVVFMAILATLTLLPAMISLFGDKVNAWRVPFFGRSIKSEDNSKSGFWVNITKIVTRKPWISVSIVVVILGLATVPYFSKSTGMSGITGLPDTLGAKKGYLVMQQEFHIGMDAPAMVVIDGDINTASTQSAIAALQKEIAANSNFTGSVVAPYPDKNLAGVYAGMSGDPLSKASMDAVGKLRTDYIPAAFGDSDVNVLVTGQTAGILDFNQTTNTYTPIVFLFVLSLSFVILTLAFRSIVIPATAIVMNMLSVGAAYGLIVLVFQKGVGASLFGFQQVDVIESWLPLFLFALLFGLSMDYHVFLLSRIREHYQKHGDNAEAVTYGLRSTGKLITGAALIMVAVFGGFAMGDMAMFQQMGFGLAVAVFLDATLVRTVLVPATMKILGKYNWYLPKWLAWIPNISLGENVVDKPVIEIPGMQLPQGNLVPVPVMANDNLPVRNRKTD